MGTEEQIAQAEGTSNWPCHREAPHSAPAADVSDVSKPGSSLGTFLKLTKTPPTIPLSHWVLKAFSHASERLTTF